jgi:prolyl-tRNA synthetase
MSNTNTNSISLSLVSAHEFGITAKKDTEHSDWYHQVVIKSNMIEYSDVAGCYVLLPYSYSMWEFLQSFLNSELKNRNVKNTYFPLFATRRNLEKEKEHIEGFEPEVAWVTKVGSTQIEEPIAIRPTSETIIYPTFARLIRSHSDLPLKFNQWCNVVRWEFKDTIPFIRSREFLWQEGHTAHESEKNALTEVMDIISLYKDVYESQLAVPVILGKKTEKEKFAGALCTYTIESITPVNGKGIQCATAHCLGQHFSKMFDIKFQTLDGIQDNVWQNSWGFTTRSIGVMVMTHADDAGLVLPPTIAPTQIVIIPIYNKTNKDAVLTYVQELFNTLRNQFRVELDITDHRPGWKYNYWEKLGVPLRIEVGPRDLTTKKLTIVKRHNSAKSEITSELFTTDYVNNLLKLIQTEMFEKAKNIQSKHLSYPNSIDEFIQRIENNCTCSILWCGDENCEINIKEKTGAKSLCMPTDFAYKLQIQETDICVNCAKKAIVTCLFGKSY